MDSSKQETIGKKIKKRRHELKLTQEGLARKADIPYTTFVKIEADVVKSPSVDTVKKIA
ncbi:MAG TPA: XRE family transcriptional regulator, partial [Bacteroidia bacterium]|nr:XRE family transcriptional regulator [Bacteroidia bacterium]